VVTSWFSGDARMKPVDAEFVEAAWPSRAALFGFATLLTLTVVGFLDIYRTGVQANEVRADAALRHQLVVEELRLKGEHAAATPSEVAVRLGGFYRLRDLGWPRALTLLEVAPRDAVTLDAIDFDVTARSLDIDMTTQDNTAAVAYLDALNSGESSQDTAWRWSIKEVRTQASGERHRVAIHGVWQQQSSSVVTSTQR
jgi:hypothetical protein